jgi:hypothetical protein
MGQQTEKMIRIRIRSKENSEWLDKTKMLAKKEITESNRQRS